MKTDDPTVDATAASGQGRSGAPSPADRLRLARRRGTPRWLWPEVDAATWREALSAMEAAATALLAGRGAVLPVRAQDDRALGLAAYTSGLGPWLGWHLERGALDTDGAAAGVLAEHLEHNRQRAVRLAAERNRALAALAGAGGVPVVLKGAHTSHVHFPEPGTRPMSDLDLLVDGAVFGRAEAALAEAGYVRVPAGRVVVPPRSEWRPRGSAPLPVSMVLVHRDDPIAIDLHGSPDIDFFGVHTVPFSRIAGDLRAHEPAVGAAVFVQPLLAVHLAVHASHGLHGLTLIRLVELALVLERDVQTRGAWQDVGAVLTELSAARFAYPAFALVERLRPGSVDADVLHACRAAAPPRLRAILDRATPAGVQRMDTLSFGERFCWCSGVAEHLRRFRTMLLPTGGLRPASRLRTIYAERFFRLLHGRVAG